MSFGCTVVWRQYFYENVTKSLLEINSTLSCILHENSCSYHLNTRWKFDANCCIICFVLFCVNRRGGKWQKQMFRLAICVVNIEMCVKFFSKLSSKLHSIVNGNQFAITLFAVKLIIRIGRERWQMRICIIWKSYWTRKGFDECEK